MNNMSLKVLLGVLCVTLPLLVFSSLSIGNRHKKADNHLASAMQQELTEKPNCPKGLGDFVVYEFFTLKIGAEKSFDRVFHNFYLPALKANSADHIQQSTAPMEETITVVSLFQTPEDAEAYLYSEKVREGDYKLQDSLFSLPKRDLQVRRSKH